MQKNKNLDRLNGIKFLEQISEHEDQCSANTLEQLPKMGEKAPLCYETLGMVLALIDCSASCYWGCSGGDHKLENLVGRSVNTAYAAMDLGKRGYYDQSYSQARALGETANLLMLFKLDPESAATWKSASERELKKQFTPFNVRMRVENLGGMLPVKQDRYAKLSSISVHANPNNIPQSHGPKRIGITFPKYQPAGFLTALHEIAHPVAFIGVLAANVLGLGNESRTVFLNTAELLIETIGGISIMEDGKPWFKSI